MNLKLPALGIVFICFALLAGCDSNDHTDTSTATISSTELTLPMPERIRAITALDPASITGVATVNGVRVQLSRTATGSYLGSHQVSPNGSYSVEVEFSEQFDGQRLVLATNTSQVNVGIGNATVELRRSDYDFSRHDADGDSFSNIVEREENSDPRDATQTPDLFTVHVIAGQPLAFLNSSFSDYQVETSLGNETRLLNASGNQFRGSFQVTRGVPLNVRIQVIEQVTGQRLEVASQSRQISVPVDQQTILFESSNYSTQDRDGDGQSDLEELVAGTDMTVNNSATNDSFTVSFSVPAQISNPLAVYGELRINDQLTALDRNVNNYFATANGQSGNSVLVQVRIMDNFNNQPYVLATAEKTISLAGNAQQVVFSATEFSLQIDTDNDGVVNHVEREQGTDPFNPPATPFSCVTTEVPIVSGAAGEQVTIENISAHVQCGAAVYRLAASQFGFSWDPPSNSISWQIPATSAAGSSIEIPVEVQNPDNSAQVYGTLQIRARVGQSACTPTSTTTSYLPTKDLFRTNGRVASLGPLRLRKGNRQVLIGFNVGPQTGQLTAAALHLAVTDDEGSGTVAVYQDDSFIWSESDSRITLPALNSPIGSLDTDWNEDVTHTIGLTSLFVSGDEVTFFLLQESGNDVAFGSRESDDPPQLDLTYTVCN